LLKRKTRANRVAQGSRECDSHAFVRQRVRRDEDFFAAARPPRAPAARTDIVPRPVLRDELRDDGVLAEDVRAVARPPLAPAFFFCAVEPARPPFAPAALTDIVPRPRVLRDAAVVLFREAVVVFFSDTAVVFFFGDAAVVFLRAPVDRVFARAVVVFLRDPDDEARGLEELPDDFELDFDVDFASPDCERCLLTVRAAISFERFVDRPCFRSESRMCSY
jgi:hypothetical protein